MKRIAILLTVFIVLVWVGSKFNSPSMSASGPKKEMVIVSSEPEKPLSPAEKKAQQEKWHGAKTIVAAKRAVRNSLKDPETAQFKDVYANYTEEFGVVACGRVNAKNSFGAYGGFKRFVSSGKSVILEGQDNITDAWTDACSLDD